MRETKRSHPSYGVIRLSRVSGGDGRHYGSPIENHSFLSIEIAEGETVYNEDLATEKIHGNKTIIRIELTHDQFAQFITTGGVHEGTPCTIAHRDGKRIDFDSEVTSEIQKINETLKTVVQELMEDMPNHKSQLDDILSKKSLSNADRDEIRKLMNDDRRAIQGKLPWYATRIQETISDMVHRAKMEIESCKQLSGIAKETKLIGLD